MPVDPNMPAYYRGHPAGAMMWEIIKANQAKAKAAADQKRADFTLHGEGARDTSLMDFANTRGGSPYRDQQTALANVLMGQATGQNSFAREQLRQDMGRAQSAQQSMAAGARPNQSAMAARLAMQNMGNIQSGMAGQSALAGIAERNAAANALGAVLQGARGQDNESYLGSMDLANQNAHNALVGSMGFQQNETERYAHRGKKWWEHALGALGQAGATAAAVGKGAAGAGG